MVILHSMLVYQRVVITRGYCSYYQRLRREFPDVVHSFLQRFEQNFSCAKACKSFRQSNEDEHVQAFCNMGMGQNPIPLVNIKIAGKWMFIPLKWYV